MELKQHLVLKSFFCAALGVYAVSRAPAAEPPKAPVPKSPYIAVVYRYADAMLERGRDTYGPQKTGLFLSALDRITMSALTNRPPPPEGVREEARVGPRAGPLTGANAQHDQNLLRLLSTLSELSAKPKYRQAADEELKWLLRNAKPFWNTWDVGNDRLLVNPEPGNAQPVFRPWMLWAKCLELVPAARKYLEEFSVIQRPVQVEFSRVAGFQIRACAEAYFVTADRIFLRSTEDLLGPLEKDAGLDSLSIAIDLAGASTKVPEPLATRLELLADGIDERFLRQRAQIGSAGPLWKARAGERTIAQVGMMCVSRYDNTGKVGYRRFLLAAADAYLKALPEKDIDVWPGTFGHTISLEIAAWRHTAKPIYFNRARKLADWAVENFWGTNALPRASLHTDHYESITGADTLALALLELHLQVLHITAVRCPPNTIDR